ncbi:Uncharacterised protein [Mycobacteroides abscessus subsp. abscessus]|nr:Uncharacterised protein [Mycobacteroides abscessus subsp. abscessus]SKU10221.1 Uncharacterised protein [Mycobacteroides abscessus subsp. abscessus]
MNRRFIAEVEYVGGHDDGRRCGLGQRYSYRSIHQVGQLLGHHALLHVVTADVFVQAQEIDLLLV